MKYWLILLAIFLALTSCNDGKNRHFHRKRKKKKTLFIKYVTFPSIDQLSVYAKVFYADTLPRPCILMCHQARFNKTEYDSIARKVVAQGFTCMAVDLRSGGDLGDSINQTHDGAVRESLRTDYLDSEKDIIAALTFLKINLKAKKLIIWGSSYSASLALKIAKEYKDVSAVIAFSPGEYFEDQLKVAVSISGLNKPTFITSSRAENNAELSGIVRSCVGKNLVHFVPINEGKHGSSALWPTTSNNEEYWVALNKFLKSIKNIDK